MEIGSLGEELYGGAGGISMDKAVRGGLACSTLDRHCFETPNSWVASLSELTAISDHLVNAIQTDQCIVYVFLSKWTSIVCQLKLGIGNSRQTINFVCDPLLSQS